MHDSDDGTSQEETEAEEKGATEREEGAERGREEEDETKEEAGNVEKPEEKPVPKSAIEGVDTIGVFVAFLERRRVRPAGAGSAATKPSWAGELTGYAIKSDDQLIWHRREHSFEYRVHGRVRHDVK